MNEYVFNAYALEGETDLNRIAAGLKIGKKFKWEEPLVLNPFTLDLHGGRTFHDQRVYLFYFGAAVFFNCPEELISRFYKNIIKATDAFRSPRSQVYRESYSLRVREGEKIAVTNDCAIMQQEESVYVDIIAYTIAKSVALEQIEARVEIVFDKMEEIIAMLDRGQLAISDNEVNEEDHDGKYQEMLLRERHRLAHLLAQGRTVRVIICPDAQIERVELGLA